MGSWNGAYGEVDNVEDDDQVVEKGRGDHRHKREEYLLGPNLTRKLENKYITGMEVYEMSSLEFQHLAETKNIEKIMDAV